MASIFEGQPLKTRPFRIKTRVIWVLDTYIQLVDPYTQGFFMMHIKGLSCEISGIMIDELILFISLPLVTRELLSMSQ